MAGGRSSAGAAGSDWPGYPLISAAGRKIYASAAGGRGRRDGKVRYIIRRKVKCGRCGRKMKRGEEQVDIFCGRVFPICPECLAEVSAERAEKAGRWSELVAEIEDRYQNKAGGPGKKSTRGAAGRGRAKKKGEEQDVRSGQSGGEEA